MSFVSGCVFSLCILNRNSEQHKTAYIEGYNRSKHQNAPLCTEGEDFQKCGKRGWIEKNLVKMRGLPKEWYFKRD